jgi:antitoxin CptB
MNADAARAANADAERIDLNRVVWRSRRGMLELDLLLRPFARECYPALAPALKSWYRDLLEREDQDIWHWLQGVQAPPDELADVIAAIGAYHQGRGA